MLLGSKQHTAGDTRLWKISYDRWLDNTATIQEIELTPDADDCTIDDIVILGREVNFILAGGTINTTCVVAVKMTDSLKNVKTDSLMFTFVAP